MIALFLWACSGSDAGPVPEPAPPSSPSRPVLAPCKPGVTSPAAVAPFPLAEETARVLEGVVRAHAADPANPWAIAHAMLALGKDLKLSDGSDAVDTLFSKYARRTTVGTQVVIEFPPKDGQVRIEPHRELLLKTLVDAGVEPQREVQVEGRPAVIADLYVRALDRAWVDGERHGYGSWNDAPWSVGGISGWASPSMAWTTADGKSVTLDALTHALVVQHRQETAFLHEAAATGADFKKRGQGIFKYTCGGAHLTQGAVAAVSRGFGSDADRDAVRAELDAWVYRYPRELSQTDAALAQHPEHGVVLMVQRLKFLGHFLETTHRAAAAGVWSPDDAAKAQLAHALQELIVTVQLIERSGAYARLAEIRASSEQTYLDYVGDSAHALRGLNMAIGRDGTCL